MFAKIEKQKLNEQFYSKKNRYKRKKLYQQLNNKF